MKPKTKTLTFEVPEAREIPRRLAYVPEEAGALLSISRSTVYNLLRAGRLRGVHIGDKLVIPDHELSRFLAEECPQAYQEPA